MAKTSTMNVPDELREQFRKSIEQRDRYILGVAQGAKRLLSDRERKKLSRTAIINSPQVGRGSMFRYLSPLWRELTTEQKEVWRDAAAFSFINGWQLFISDNAQRIKNSLTLGVAPSDLWQVRGGRISIESPASSIKLSQNHPLDYLVTRKIRGTPWKEEMVTVRESFGLPIELQIRYKSDLTPTGDTQIARYYAEIWSSYQGVDTMTPVSIDFDPESDWQLDTVSFSDLRGIIVGYTLYIEIVGYTGSLMYDNLRVYHSGQNWARDPRCDNVSRVFNKQFAQVEPFWIPLDLPSGATFETVYPPLFS